MREMGAKGAVLCSSKPSYGAGSKSCLYECEGFDYLKHVVTWDESWFHYWTPECKEKLRVWKTVEGKAPRKLKEQPSAGKDSGYRVLGLSRDDHDWTQWTRQNSDCRPIYTDASLTGNYGEEMWITVGMRSPNAWNTRPHTATLTTLLLADCGTYSHIPSILRHQITICSQELNGNRCGTAHCDHRDYCLFGGKLVYSRNRKTHTVTIKC